uniref:Uncharacterized protein n=1 Tax=Meloidogyne enterolobii TaxID=390850 RepID=A0A6V7WP47_MELEN|nr:unnamed protein product [Meloidogyne enterolobii]CAD2197781.1 unnamed protein product [Meloidogyne enterolobii]CAD2201836.1 unnamed protein product [Meloidogyne enterolobii]
MNFNVFNNWAVWGVIDDDDDEQKSSSKQEKEQQQQPKQIESEKNKETTIIVPDIEMKDEALQVTTKKEEDILKETNDKILEIVLGSDDEDSNKPIDWVAEMDKKENDIKEEIKEEMNMDKEIEQPKNPFIEPKCVNPEKTLHVSIIKRRSMPLIDYLCQLRNCVLKEMHVLFYNIDARREIIHHLQNFVHLRTSHLPTSRNFNVRCNDLTVQSACNIPAMGGYLGITVS